MKPPIRVRDDSESKKEINSIKKIIVKMELENMPIYTFLENFLLKLQNPKKGVPAKDLMA